VEAFQMTLSHSHGSLTISWPDAPNANLESTTNLRPLVVWSLVTNQQPPALIGGQRTMTIPIGSGTKFFRLHGTNNVPGN
jgi:hypothetical protein